MSIPAKVVSSIAIVGGFSMLNYMGAKSGTKTEEGWLAITSVLVLMQIGALLWWVWS